MKELHATVELILSEGWRGDAKTQLAEVQASYPKVKEVHAKLSAIIEGVKIAAEQQHDLVKQEQNVLPKE